MENILVYFKKLHNAIPGNFYVWAAGQILPFTLYLIRGTKRYKSNYKTGSNSDKSAKPMYMHNAVSVQNLIFSHGIVYAICSK